MNVVLAGTALRVTTELGAPWANLHARWLTFPAAGTAVPTGYSGQSALQQGVSSNGISSFDQANVAASQSGAMTQGYVLRGDSSATMDGALGLSMKVGVSGDALALVTGDAALKNKTLLVAEAAAYLTQSGFASLGYSLEGFAQALTDTLGALNYGQNLFADGTASVTQTASASLGVSIAGDSAATGDGLAALNYGANIVGSAESSLTQTGSAQVGVAMSGAVDALADAAGTMNYGANLAGGSDATLAEGAVPLGLILYVTATANVAGTGQAGLQLMGVLTGTSAATWTQTGTAQLPSFFSGQANAILLGEMDLHGKLFMAGGTETNQYQDMAGAVWAHSSGALVRKILANKRVLDQATGILTLYGDDDVTPIAQIPVYSDVGGTVLYDGTKPVHHQGRLG